MKNKDSLLIPGPTPVVDSIYDALSEETRAHTDPRFVRRFKQAIERTKRILNTDGEVFIVAGSGTLVMEMALVNTMAPGDRLLVISHGYFGDRFTKLAHAFGYEIDVLQAEWGSQVSPDDVEQQLSKHTYKAVTVTHADTSTGVKADLDRLIPLIKQHGALAIVDGVCATTAMPEDMQHNYDGDNTAIDIVLTGSQKAIGVPPGVGIVAFSKAALAARRAMDRIPAYYADIENWLPIMEDPSKYFATPPVNMIYALEEGLRIVEDEGLSKRYARHEAYGRAVRTALRVYGMVPLAEEEDAAPTLSCIRYPEGVDDPVFRATLSEQGIILSGALAHLAGKAFRIGHMGNTTAEMLEDAVRKIGETLKDGGNEADVDRAVGVFQETIGTLSRK
ncbi:serine--pyruvate aminotransferase [Sporosarcina sp. NCCP-2716]|uniref:pyridoxal-phosphate-dependent aminotransferase family protein n=1 Tax=Sporosarcina sp. NCCP-2716 TaxID=2943679 RepID=UPI00203BF19F|nr:alanine--glyoxylate aminotransferase family protein [Sporosarcina sp. NCCP-2716]GKV69351.1 serine--pyruvate aminotransferase [Sporosarcina sp. NCCP-2716]